MALRVTHITSGGAIYRHRYIAPPEAVCSAPTDMYRPFAVCIATATYHLRGRYITAETSAPFLWDVGPLSGKQGAGRPSGSAAAAVAA